MIFTIGMASEYYIKVPQSYLWNQNKLVKQHQSAVRDVVELSRYEGKKVSQL